MNSFDFNRITDFDDHIRLSIPSYDVLSSVFKGITEYFSYEGGTVIDLGCSTGSFLNSLEKKTNCRYVGVDTVDMVEAQEFMFVWGDCVKKLPDYDGSVIICMFLLQFLGKKKRAELVEELSRQVNNGAVLLIAEKIELDCTKLQTLIHRMHIKEKRKGFTAEEILDKDEQLANSMHCLTESELLRELGDIGEPTRVWQGYNFVGYVVRKG